MTHALFTLGLHLQRRTNPANRRAARVLLKWIKAQRALGLRP